MATYPDQAGCQLSIGPLVTNIRLLVWVIIKWAGCAWIWSWAFNNLGQATLPNLRYLLTSMRWADGGLYNPTCSLPLELLLIPVSGSSSDPGGFQYNHSYFLHLSPIGSHEHCGLVISPRQNHNCLGLGYLLLEVAQYPGGTVWSPTSPAQRSPWHGILHLSLGGGPSLLGTPRNTHKWASLHETLSPHHHQAKVGTSQARGVFGMLK
jgi:hypothetical protein